MITSLGFSRNVQTVQSQELSDDDSNATSSQTDDDDQFAEQGEVPSDTTTPSISSPITRLELTESLLPRDNVTRSVFSLPEPGRTPRHKYHDPLWTVAWCTSLLFCAVGLLSTFFLTHKPVESPSALPYSTLLHAVPFLTLVTVLSTVGSYAFLIALHNAVYPILVATIVFVPFILVVSSIWAFSGSFIWGGGENTWGETVGLRLYSMIPLALAFLCIKSLQERRYSLVQTAKVTELGITLLRTHWPLLALSPSLLLASLLASLPFLSLLFRLFLIGYFTGSGEIGSLVWHIRAYAGWLIFAVLLIWLWSWFVVRGIMRTACASVIGAWYFRRSAYRDPVQATHAALARAGGPSLGTICLASLLLSIVQGVVFVLRCLRRVTSLSFMPNILHPLSFPISIAQRAMNSISLYALIYTGLSGERFSVAVERSRSVTSVKRGGSSKRHYSFISTLLSMVSFAIGSCLAVATYLFTAHTLQSPFHAPIAAALGGLLSSLVVWFSTCLLVDVADTLYLCYCLDREAGAQHSALVFGAFEGRRAPHTHV